MKLIKYYKNYIKYIIYNIIFFLFYIYYNYIQVFKMEINTVILIICIIILLYVYMQSGCVKKLLQGFTDKNGNNIKISPYSGQAEANPGVYTEYLVSCNDKKRKIVLLNPMDVYTHQDGRQNVPEKYKFKQLNYNNDVLPTGVFDTPMQAAQAVCNIN